jgi:hypothetical protein
MPCIDPKASLSSFLGVEGIIFLDDSLHRFWDALVVQARVYLAKD